MILEFILWPSCQMRKQRGGATSPKPHSSPGSEHGEGPVPALDLGGQMLFQEAGIEEALALIGNSRFFLSFPLVSPPGKPESSAFDGTSGASSSSASPGGSFSLPPLSGHPGPHTNPFKPLQPHAVSLGEPTYNQAIHRVHPCAMLVHPQSHTQDTPHTHAPQAQHEHAQPSTHTHICTHAHTHTHGPHFHPSLFPPQAVPCLSSARWEQGMLTLDEL